MSEYTVDWTTEVPVIPALYWAYEALDPSSDADVMLVQLAKENGDTFFSVTHKGMTFPKEHFSHFAPVENFSFAGLEYPQPPTGVNL